MLGLLQAVMKGSAPGLGPYLVASLPAAQEISSDDIAKMLAEAVINRVRSVEALLKLPAARPLGAKFVLEMVPKAVGAGLGAVAVELGRYGLVRWTPCDGLIFTPHRTYTENTECMACISLVSIATLLTPCLVLVAHHEAMGSAVL